MQDLRLEYWPIALVVALAYGLLSALFGVIGAELAGVPGAIFCAAFVPFAGSFLFFIYSAD